MSSSFAPIWVCGVLTIGAIVAAAGARQRRQSAQLIRLVQTGTSQSDSIHSSHYEHEPAVSGHSLEIRVAAWIGGCLLRILPRQTGAHPATVGRVTAVFVVTALINPLLGLAVISFAVTRSRRLRRLDEAKRIANIRTELGLILDLLRVAVSAGMTLRQAIVVVCSPESANTKAAAEGQEGELSALLFGSVQAVSRGERFVDSIAAMVDTPIVGSELRLLASTLISTERFGTPPGPALATLASDVRDLRRRLAEAEARRVPVRMLAPLVLLLLPSFALLTIAPLLAGGLSSLRLTP